MDPGKLSKIEDVIIEEKTSSLDEISSRFPNGVFTTFRTFQHNKILLLESHFRRLEESATLLNRPIILNRTLIKDALREVIKLSKEQELRIRLTIDLDNLPVTIYISKEPLITPNLEDYENGVITVTRKTVRNNPKAKLTSFLQYAKKIRDDVPNNVKEVLMVNSEGQILEGLSSNFFAIINGEIWTEDKHVLSGIVRSVILELASTAGVRIHLSAIYISEIESLEEAFLTSTSRLVIPIQKIDSHLVGTGKPGQITKKLMGLYQRRIQRVLKEI